MSGPSVQIPTSWLQADELEDLGADTVMLMLTALAYCADQTDDGWIARRRLRKLWTVDDLDQSIERLVKAGELEEHGDRLFFTHWRRFILAAEEVDRIKESSRERTERSRKHKRGDHSMCLSRYCDAARNASQTRDSARDITRDSNGVQHVSDALPYRTDPIRTDPTARSGRTERETGTQDGSAGAPPPSGPRIGQGLVAPHDWVGPPGVDEDQLDDLEPSERLAMPCHQCGAPSLHDVHYVHKFVVSDRVDVCDECLELFDNLVHTAYDDYLQAKAEGMWWPPL